MLRALLRGCEYCPAMGMKNCGITEHAPMTKLAAHTT